MKIPAIQTDDGVFLFDYWHIDTALTVIAEKCVVFKSVSLNNTCERC